MLGRRRTVVAVLLSVVGLSMAAGLVAPAQASAKDRYSLGDSVMLGAKGALQDKGFRVNAAESRQAYVGPRMLRHVADLPTNVVVHLGTNGTYPLSTCKALVRAAGPERRVFLVTVHVPRSWQNANNRMMRACAAAFPAGRVHVVDWNAVASRHRNWLYADHIHLKPAGARGYAALMDGAVTRADAEARARALAGASGSGTAAVDG